MAYPAPQSKVVIVSDGGDDFSHIAAIHDCDYHQMQNKTNNKNLVFSKAESIFEYAHRLGTYCKEFSNSHFLLLEDDVLTLKCVQEKTLLYDINGCNKNEFFDQPVSHELRKHNPRLSSSKKIWYGACGGSIFKTEFMVNLLTDKSRLMEEARFYCSRASRNKWASDAFLSYLCLKHGGTIGQYPGFCETWHPDYGDRMVEGSIEILHQYKRLYEHNS
ncbi:MAG: hypothetical protein EB101_09760 [Chitinophagia bacterium]|nr:hypothetical protein [Chitinophagia bacterium]